MPSIGDETQDNRETPSTGALGKWMCVDCTRYARTVPLK